MSNTDQAESGNKRMAKVPNVVTLLVQIVSATARTNKSEAKNTTFDTYEARVVVLNLDELWEIFGKKQPQCTIYEIEKNKKVECGKTLVPGEFKIKTSSLLESGMVVMFHNVYVIRQIGKNGIEYLNFEAQSTVQISAKGVPVRLPTDGEINFDLPVEDETLAEESVDSKRIAVRIGKKWRVHIQSDSQFDEVVKIKKEINQETKAIGEFHLIDAADPSEATCNIKVFLSGCNALMCLPKGADNKSVKLGPNGAKLIPTWRRFLETVLTNPFGWVGVSGGYDHPRTLERQMEDVYGKTQTPVIAWPRLWVGKAFKNFLVKAKYTKTMHEDIKLPSFSFPPGLLPFRSGLRVVAFFEPDMTPGFLLQNIEYMYWFIPVQDKSGWGHYEALMKELRTMEGEEHPEFGKPGVTVSDVTKTCKSFSDTHLGGRNPFGTPILVLFQVFVDPKQRQAVNDSWKKLVHSYYEDYLPTSNK